VNDPTYHGDVPPQTRKFPPYVPCECGADCDLLGDVTAGACFGRVRVLGEVEIEENDWRWVHACEAHGNDFEP
jgi:hypothetical protein